MNMKMFHATKYSRVTNIPVEETIDYIIYRIYIQKENYPL